MYLNLIIDAHPWEKGGTTFFSLKKRDILYNPAIMFLGIYPDELKIFVHTKACT